MKTIEMVSYLSKETGPIFWGLLFGFGLFLVFIGIINALSSITTINLNGTRTVTFPHLYVGTLLSIPGLIITIVAFLGMRHGLSRMIKLGKRNNKDTIRS
jgi:hypothetical protein